VDDPTGETVRTTPQPGGGRKSAILAKVKLVRDVGLVSFGRYGQYLITLITLPLIARILGTEGVGLLAIGMSAYFLGALIIDLGITTFLAAELRDEDVRTMRSNYLVIRLGILAIIGAATTAVYVLDNHVHVQMIMLGLLCGGISSMGEGWILLGQGKFGKLVLIEMSGRIAYLILLVTILPHVRTAEAAMLCLVGSSAIPVAWTWLVTVRAYGMPRRPQGLGPMLRLGAPVLTSRMLENTYEQGVATLFSMALSTRSMGIFSASDRPIQAISSTLDAIGFSLLPRLAARKHDSDFWSSIRRGITSVFVIAVVASIAAALIAPFAIPLIFGEQFERAVAVMQLQAFILPGTAVASFITTAVLPICRDTRGVLYGSSIGTACILVFLGIALHNHSVWAMVTGMLVAESVAAVFYLFRVRHLMRVHPSLRQPDDDSDATKEELHVQAGGS
jgi:O-antigen/teichoic acid export membrane protein